MKKNQIIKKSDNEVHYHNELNQLQFKDFSLQEFKLFFSYLSEFDYDEKGEKTLTFQRIKELMNLENESNERMVSIIESTYDKMIKLNFKIGTKTEFVKFVLFTRYKVSLENAQVDMKINEEFKYIVNELKDKFSVAKLNLINGFKSKYSLRLYAQLCQVSKLKSENLIDGYNFLSLKIEEFKRILDIPDSYTMDNINKRVLKPIEEELSIIYDYFAYEKIKKGRKITSIKFLFREKSNRTTYKKSDDSLTIDYIDPDTDIEELKNWFKNKFPSVNYTKKIAATLEKLLKKRGLHEVQKYCVDTYNDCIKQNPRDLNAYFSKMLAEDKRISRSAAAEKIEEQKRYEEQRKEVEIIPQKPKAKKEILKKIIEEIKNENIEEKLNEDDKLYLKFKKLPLHIQKELEKKAVEEHIKTNICSYDFLEVMKKKSEQLYSSTIRPKLIEILREYFEDNKDNDDSNGDAGIEIPVEETVVDKEELVNQDNLYKYDIDYVKESIIYSLANKITKWSARDKDLVKNVIDEVYNMLDSNLKKDIFRDLLLQNDIEKLIDSFQEEFLEKYNENFGQGIIKNNKKAFEVRTKNLKEKVIYIKENLEEFKKLYGTNLFLDKNNNQLVGGALESRIKKLLKDKEIVLDF